MTEETKTHQENDPEYVLSRNRGSVRIDKAPAGEEEPIMFATRNRMGNLVGGP